MPLKKTNKNRKRNSNGKKKNRIKRSVKKIKKNIVKSFKFVSNKMTILLKDISKNIKINSIGRYMLYLKINNPDRYDKIKTLGDHHFEKIKRGDKETIKDMEKHLSSINVDEILEQAGGDSSWTGTDYVKAPFLILILAYLYALFRWECKFGKGSKRYCP